jgi:hypothetical protein
VTIKGGCRTHAQGSAEAVRDSVQALASETVAVKVVQVGVGPVTSFDVDMASSTGATIVAFNVKMADSTADALAKQRAVDVLQHRIIYRLLEEVRRILFACACCMGACVISNVHHSCAFCTSKATPDVCALAAARSLCSQCVGLFGQMRQLCHTRSLADQ